MRTFLISALLPLVIAAQVIAQDGSLSAPTSPADGPETFRDATRPTRTQPQTDRGVNLTFRPRGEYAFDADLRDSQGSVSVARAGGTLGLAVPVSPGTRLLFNADGEWSRYDFSDASDLLPSGNDPIKDAYLVRLSPGIVHRLDEEWSLTGGAIVEFAAQSGADIGDSITYGGYAGARYRWSDALSTTFGVIAKTRLEDDAIVVPLLGIEWKLTDRLTLENEGLGLKLVAQLDDTWRAGLFARWELRDYRLSDDASVPDGVLRDQRVPLGVSIEYRPTPSIQVELSAGAIVYQKYTFDNDNGDEVGSDRTRPAPFVGLTATLAF